MVVPVHICAAACHGDVDVLRAYFASGDRDPNDICEGRASPRLGQIGTRMAFPRIVDREERDFLVRLFAWAPAGRTDARRRTRSAQVAVTAAPLPRDVFKLVVSFWRPNREWWWSSYTYSRVNRYDAPWMG